ncbi:MAG: SH3 domain-containing protein [bacterium]|nr:SH3 domain-containing protein [bacterium]
MKMRSSSALFVLTVIFALIAAIPAYAAAPIVYPAGVSITNTNNLIVIFVPFTDEPGDTQSATINWGDGAIEPGLIDGGGVNGAHIYNAVGTYTITIQINDNTGFSTTYAFGVSVTVLGITPPPPVDLCVNYSGSVIAGIVANVPPQLVNTLRCRPLAIDTEFTDSLGIVTRSGAAVGNADIIAQGVIAAVDVFSLENVVSLPGVGICLRGTGTLVLLAGAPRTPTVLGGFTAAELPGFTCSGVPTVGTLVLVGNDFGGFVGGGGVESNTTPRGFPRPQGYAPGVDFALSGACVPLTRGVVYVRSLPTENSDFIRILGDSTPVQIETQTGRWYVFTLDGVVGYIRADLLSFQCGFLTGTGAVG